MDCGAFRPDLLTYSLKEMEQVLARFVADMLRVKPRTRSHDEFGSSMWCFGIWGWILRASVAGKPA